MRQDELDSTWTALHNVSEHRVGPWMVLSRDLARTAVAKALGCLSTGCFLTMCDMGNPFRYNLDHGSGHSLNKERNPRLIPSHTQAL